LSRAYPTQMNDTTHPTEVQPFTVTVSAAGAELHITFPSSEPIQNCSFEYVCDLEGIEQFNGLALHLLSLLSHSLEDIVAWRFCTLDQSDLEHIPSLVYGLPDPVELMA